MNIRRGERHVVNGRFLAFFSFFGELARVAKFAIRAFFVLDNSAYNTEETKYFCHACGTELTEENSREVPSSYSKTGISHLCLDCEQRRFNDYERIYGRALALFFSCMTFDVPCKPVVLDGTDFETTDEPWVLYVDMLLEKGQDRKGKEVLSFNEGVTNFLRLFGKDFTEKDFAAYLRNEREKAERLPGTPEQRERWGEEPLYRDIPMTSRIYDLLDRAYTVRVKTYAGQTLSDQQEVTLRNVARNDVIYSYAMSNGLIKLAKDIQKMSDEALASEQMRKKDEKPLEAYAIDAQINALERAGAVKDGKFLNLEGVQKAIWERFIKHRKFGYSIDAGDQMLAAIYSVMRTNADLFIPTEMPQEFELEDMYGEFEEEEQDTERENKRFAGMVPLMFEKENKQSGNGGASAETEA